MINRSTRFDSLRRSFWIQSAAAMLIGLILGLTMPLLDEATHANVPIFALDKGTSSALLEVIGTVAMSVAGIAFSVIVVALQLASQQLSPRVLRTFQTDRLSKAVLALLVGTFIYSLTLLARLGATVEAPELALTLALVLALVAFAVFGAFIHRTINLLQASTLIARIAVDGQRAVDRRYPADIAHEPHDPEAARTAAREWMASSCPGSVRAPRAGFLTAVDGEVVMQCARRRGALVRQSVQVGDFVVTGQLLAEVWSCDEEELASEVSCAFRLEHERSVVQDVAFPIRQLADVALRALSPSLNDPTTAENAMGSLTDTLVLLAGRGDGVEVRVDEGGTPRFVACSPTLDDLVRLGFEQVRVQSAGYPVVAAAMIRMLGEVERAAREAGSDSEEAARQARLLAEGTAGAVPTRADEDRVAAAHIDRDLDGAREG